MDGGGITGGGTPIKAPDIGGEVMSGISFCRTYNLSG